MDERRDLLLTLRQLIELDRGFGIEFAPRSAAADAPAPTPPEAPRPTPSAIAARQPGPANTPAAAPVRAPSAAPPPVTGSAAPAPATTVPPEERWQPTPELLDRPAAEGLAEVARVIAGCRQCRLCATRTRTVPGEGAPQAELLFVGEGPGADEDRAGRPFVGAAGQLLDRMIAAMGLRRDEVFIANVVKCRPPGNRTPEPDEAAACMPYLRAQIALIRPKIICTLGNVPLKALMGADSPGITRVRGQRMQYQGIVLIPTFHPSYLLRNPEAKKPCWDDLKVVLRELGRTPPAR